MKFIECRSWDGECEYGFLNIEEIVTITRNEYYCTVYYRNNSCNNFNLWTYENFVKAINDSYISGSVWVEH